MNLHEYQARELFQRYGVPTPQAGLATSPEEARRIAEKIAAPVVVKSQVLVGGRGKAGGIKRAATPREAEEAARQLLRMEIKGERVRRLLVAQAVEIKTELYLGAVVDRNAARITLMASSEGGIEIEELAQSAPEKIARLEVNPFLGILPYQARALAARIGLDGGLRRPFSEIATAVYRVLVDSDASLAELNPLAITAAGELLAIDTKVVLDDNAAFRQRDLHALRDEEAENPDEVEARKAEINFVKLDGNIGCVVNGAGLAMATMDLVKACGGAPANFLDMGGGARAEQVRAALRILASDPRVKAVLFNIFGGITRCDEVARGIVDAMGSMSRQLPMVVRLVGTNEDEARAILAQAQVMYAPTMQEAAELVVKVAQG
ncbi:MAG: ADP-forming succinate--CoA ligase subunit beta [Chloroflexi bacterium]|nr:ADP-forming succinate--CoA ligase subunit beta [Chloroflexota bacterium]